MEKKYEIKLVFLLFVCLFVIKFGNIVVKNLIYWYIIMYFVMVILEDLFLVDLCC